MVAASSCFNQNNDKTTKRKEVRTAVEIPLKAKNEIPLNEYRINYEKAKTMIKHKGSFNINSTNIKRTLNKSKGTTLEATNNGIGE
jgi:hypothetical protein